MSKKPRVGDSVVVTDPAHYGAQGKLIKRGRIFCQVQLTGPDYAGRRILRVARFEIKKAEVQWQDM